MEETHPEMVLIQVACLGRKQNLSVCLYVVCTIILAKPVVDFSETKKPKMVFLPEKTIGARDLKLGMNIQLHSGNNMGCVTPLPFSV